MTHDDKVLADRGVTMRHTADAIALVEVVCAALDASEVSELELEWSAGAATYSIRARK